EKKAASKITIKEICENADVNRATFYAHYVDQNDLLNKIKDEVIDSINDHIKVISIHDAKSITIIEQIFEYIRKNAKICKLLLSERGDIVFQKRVLMLVYDMVIHEITSKNKLSVQDAEYVYSFLITGCIGVIQKWLHDDMKITSKQMAEMLMKITQKILS
ncbi:MAG TPA: TetR/AcrR family transcriptional regulator, partial [Clostridiales bacterium]|nr:TetR/AcrR family transcriptional regulator [Clostridiales bacterium]